MTESAIFKFMRKTIFIIICYSSSIASHAQNFFGESGNSLYIFSGLLLLLFLLVLWIYIDTQRKNRKTKQTDEDGYTGMKIGLSANGRNLVSENQDLNNQIVKLEKEISIKDAQIKDLLEKLSALQNASQSYNSFNSGILDKDNQDPPKEENIEERVKKIIPETLGSQSNFTYLTVLNGNLVEAEPDQTIYYRSWKEKGQLMFEFVNNERTRKAINNRTIIIEPFCIKQEMSKTPDLSEKIETKFPGVLNEDFTLLKKAEIIYK